MKTTSSFILGKCRFQLKASDQALLKTLSQAFLPWSDKVTFSQSEVDEFDLDALFDRAEQILNCALNADSADRISDNTKDNIDLAVTLTLTEVLARQLNCVCLEASVLVTPQREAILIAGAANSGKTTLSLAMAMKHNFKIISEDKTFIDLSSGQIVPYARPFGFRAAGREMLTKYIERNLEPLIGNMWFFDQNLYFNEPLSASFISAISLAVSNSEQQPVCTTVISPDAFTRSILRLSNAARASGGIELLNQSLGNASCIALSGGNIAERVGTVLKLASRESSFSKRHFK